MTTLTLDHFTTWMTAYDRASAENDPQASANLFAENACYHENPFDEPIAGRAAIHAYWDKGARNMKDKESTFEILSVEGNRGRRAGSRNSPLPNQANASRWIASS